MFRHHPAFFQTLRLYFLVYLAFASIMMLPWLIHWPVPGRATSFDTMIDVGGIQGVPFVAIPLLGLGIGQFLYILVILFFRGSRITHFLVHLVPSKMAKAASSRTLRQANNENSAKVFAAGMAGMIFLFILFHWSRFVFTRCGLRRARGSGFLEFLRRISR
jgi:hypothetical protein